LEPQPAAASGMSQAARHQARPRENRTGPEIDEQRADSVKTGSPKPRENRARSPRNRENRDATAIAAAGSTAGRVLSRDDSLKSDQVLAPRLRAAAAGAKLPGEEIRERGP
jgi:hypothetical protein